jgi:hypothetical protein
LKPALLPLLVLPLLSACATTGPETRSEASFCASDLGALCTFVNAPLRLAAQIVTLPNRPYPFRPLSEPLNFVDAAGRNWVAPKGTLTDGASIPPVFLSMFGSPTDPKFAKAGALHDSYCGIGNERTPYYHTRPWKETHRMFYEALRVSGTPERQAKTLFAAVYMAGPRWLFSRAEPVVSSQGSPHDPDVTYEERGDLNGIPEADLRASLARVIAAIEGGNLTVAEIERMIDMELQRLEIKRDARIAVDRPDADDIWVMSEGASEQESPSEGAEDPGDTGGTGDPGQSGL